jgi:ankyrin repeat protein
LTHPAREPDLVGPQADPADEFLRLACLTYGSDDPVRRHNARAMLEGQPGLGADSVHVAAARADAPALRRLLSGDASLANSEGGPFRWPPLLYLAYARHDPDVSEDAVRESVAALLEAGADPDAGFLWHGHHPPFTALTGVLGEGELGAASQPTHPRWEVLARALLEAGADPNDEQTLYNRMFRPDDSHLELLFEFGLDDETALLDQLAWAVSHGFDDRVELLHRHGVDLGRVLTGAGAGGRTAWQLARWTGRNRTAALIESLGFRGELTPEDAVVAAVLAADTAQLERLEAADPDIVRRARAGRPGLVPWAAAIGAGDAVRLAVARGWDVSARARVDAPLDQPWETALHDAAGNGDLDMVRLLIELGADPDVRDARFDGTPLDWAGHFDKSDAAALLASVTGRSG